MDNLSGLGHYEEYFAGYDARRVGRAGVPRHSEAGATRESQDLPSLEEMRSETPPEPHRESQGLGSSRAPEQEESGDTTAGSTATLLQSLSGLLHSLSLRIGGDSSSPSQEVALPGRPSLASKEGDGARGCTGTHTRERAEQRPSPCTEAATSARQQVDVTVLLYDLETTGIGKTETIGICEIGCIAVVYTGDLEWVVVDSFHSYVMPNQEISPGVPNNITKGYLKKQGAKPFNEQVCGEFHAFVSKHSAVKPAILAAHNGKRYDHRILAHHGWSYDCRAADTLEWFKHKSPGRNSYSLKNLYQELFNSGVPAAHNAMPDVHALLRVMNAFKLEPGECLDHSEHWDCVMARVVKSGR